MPKDYISYQDTGYFSKLICDYLDQNKTLNSFYGRYPSLNAFKAQIKDKSNFDQEKRDTLAQVLLDQYKEIETSEATLNNIQLLKEAETFTITTGHQLNLFTGPLYFLYKIIDTVLLSRKLKEAYPEANFVPVYWMATEDHDFDEINHFRLHRKKVNWNRKDITQNDKGAVGRLNTQGLDEVYTQFCAEVGSTILAQELCELFKNAYLKHTTLAAATRYLANTLFKEFGLVILDADHPRLKELFIPYIKEELLHETSFKEVQQASKNLIEKGYDQQVTPREINLFYLDDNLRARIVNLDGKYYVNDTELVFTKEELMREVEQNPEKFSPNVIMRPLYQEVILPNLCYIGGGGELAYWFQLKAYFKSQNVAFPILLLRNSALLISEKQKEKVKKLKVNTADLFLTQNDLVNKKIRKISNIDIDFSSQKEHLVNQFKEMYAIAAQTDASFIGAVKAQEVKQLKGLDHLEKRLLKAQKRKLSDHVKRMSLIQTELFPEENLQERVTNFSDFYLNYGESFIQLLVENLDPLDNRFTVLTF